MTVMSTARLRLRALLPFLLLAGCYHPQRLEVSTLVAELARQRADALPRSAPDAAAGVLALSADEAVAYALKSNVELRALRMGFNAAEGEITSASAIENPTVEAQLLHVQSLSGSSPDWLLRFEWQPPQPIVWSGKRNAAKAGAQAVAQDVAELELAVALEVRKSHAALLALKEEHALLEQALEARKKFAALTRERMSAGGSTRLELGVAELGVAELERARDEVVASEVDAATALSNFIGASQPLQATGTLPTQLNAPPPAEAAQKDALAQRPLLQAASSRYDQQEQTLRAEHAAAWPWFRFSALPRYHRDASDPNPDDFRLGIEVTLPLFNWNLGPIRVAEATRDQRREELRGAVLKVQREVDTATRKISLRQESLRRYSELVLPSLESQEKLLTSVAGAGGMDVLEVISLQDKSLKTRRELIRLKLEHYLAWVELNRALGKPVAPQP